MRLTLPARQDVVEWVADQLGHVVDDPGRRSGLRGGQQAADAALAALDIAGYAARRNEVLPRQRRGATGLSPWIRHGLLALPEVWDAVADAPSRDRQKFRDELLWQEYARHWYARLGPATRTGVRNRLSGADADGWPRGLACIDSVLDELHDDGWLVNQTRMWLASHWAIRSGAGWQAGENEFFRHLLDGSRAANRLGWQWTTGVGSSKPYGFSRWQVEKRAPGLCDSCSHRQACPIEDWPQERPTEPVERSPLLRRSIDLDVEAGPAAVVRHGRPEAVWLTAESLGDADPALAANPDLAAVFVFDEPLLASLRLSSKRLVFLTECLIDLAQRRQVEAFVGDPAAVLDGRLLAATFAPVPGWRRLADQLGPVEIHPWPWLVAPRGDRVQSFSAWRRGVGA